MIKIDSYRSNIMDAIDKFIEEAAEPVVMKYKPYRVTYRGSDGQVKYDVLREVIKNYTTHPNHNLVIFTLEKRDDYSPGEKQVIYSVHNLIKIEEL